MDFRRGSMRQRKRQKAFARRQLSASILSLSACEDIAVILIIPDGSQTRLTTPAPVNADARRPNVTVIRNLPHRMFLRPAKPS